MNQLVTTNLGQRPGYLQQAERLSENAAASENLTSGFAVVKYRGKAWSVRYRGEETQLTMPVTLPNGQQAEVPVQDLEVVIVKQSPNMSKQWFEENYQTGTTGKFPDCFSVQGIQPDAASAKKQNTHCASCQWNQFGSRITGNNRKGKACSDHRRLAVVPGGDVENDIMGGPMLLQVPPMSLRNLSNYCKTLERLGTDVTQVITRISFAESEYPELVFAASGWIDDPMDYERIVEFNKSDLVHRMLFEEAVVAEGDPGDPSMVAEAQKVLANRPTHLRPVPSQPAQAAPAEPPPPSPQPAPAPAQAAPEPDGYQIPGNQPPPSSSRPQPVAQPQAAQPAAPKRSPFSKAAKAAQPAAQAPAKVAAAPAQGNGQAPRVISGAPPDMETAIDELLDQP